MIIHYKLCDVADVKMAVTQQMRHDLIECEELAKNMYNTKDCDMCSWKDVKFGDIGFCEIEEVIDAVVGHDACNGCFGAANDDCDNCNRK